MLPIRRTVQADEDLIEIWLGIALHDPRSADRQLDFIERRFDQLGRHPMSGVAREDVGSGIRHLIAGRHLVLHQVLDEHVLIVRVLDGRRRIDADALPGI